MKNSEIKKVYDDVIDHNKHMGAFDQDLRAEIIKEMKDNFHKVDHLTSVNEYLTKKDHANLETVRQIAEVHVDRFMRLRMAQYLKMNAAKYEEKAIKARKTISANQSKIAKERTQAKINNILKESLGAAIAKPV